MKINKLPFSTFTKLRYLRALLECKDRGVVVYNTDKFYSILIKKGYLIFKKEDELPEHIDKYKFYRLSDKFIESTDAEILKDLTGKSIKKIMSKKVISIKKIPYDFPNILAELNDCDGYVDIGNGLFRKALDFHGFTSGAGVNGHYSTGTDKLKAKIKDREYSFVIETITGKSKKAIEKRFGEGI